LKNSITFVSLNLTLHLFIWQWHKTTDQWCSVVLNMKLSHLLSYTALAS